MQFQLGRPHDARASFARAAAVDPAAPSPLLNAAAIDLHLGRYSHAFKNYRMLVDVIGACARCNLWQAECMMCGTDSISDESLI